MYVNGVILVDDLKRKSTTTTDTALGRSHRNRRYLWDENYIYKLHSTSTTATTTTTEFDVFPPDVRFIEFFLTVLI